MKNSIILKSFLTGVAILSWYADVSAKLLSPEEALTRVQTKLNGMRISGENQYKLSYTESIEKNNLIYVFNNSDKGYIIVSADNDVKPLLGYSENGAFDYERAPEALKWWISQYAEEIYRSSLHVNDKKNITTTETTDRKVIPPLILTRWGQTEQYRLDTPLIEPKDIDNDSPVHCPPGAVATAMAQVIKYYDYPSSGNDKNSYNWEFCGDSSYEKASEIISFDFENTEFNYDSMPESVSLNTSNHEVSKLMYACGVAVNTEYSPYASGAPATYIAYALRHYFKYDNNTRFLRRDLFSTSEWENLIYEELEAQRPVIYGGIASTNGHEFICDGYEEGYFHINWGWEGYYDGYFLLSSLNPGGESDGYNLDQTIICGIRPAIEDSPAPTWYPLYSNGSIHALIREANKLSVIFDEHAGVFNYSQEPVVVSFIIKAINEDSGNEYFFEYLNKTFEFKGASYSNIDGIGGELTFLLPQNILSGKYKCSLAVKTPEDNLQDILFPYNSKSDFYLNVSSSGDISIEDSSVNSIINKYSKLDIYLPNGVLIKKNAQTDFLESLPKGIYIIKFEDNSKLMIK